MRPASPLNDGATARKPPLGADCVVTTTDSETVELFDSVTVSVKRYELDGASVFRGTYACRLRMDCELSTADVTSASAESALPGGYMHVGMSNTHMVRPADVMFQPIPRSYQEGLTPQMRCQTSM